MREMLVLFEVASIATLLQGRQSSTISRTAGDDGQRMISHNFISTDISFLYLR